MHTLAVQHSAEILPVAVVGASGYSGAELLRLLFQHSGVRVVGLFGSAKRGDGETSKLSTIWPQFRGMLDLPILATSVEAVVASGCRAVFLATPHEVSAELAGEFLAAGLTVLDLSGAFRLDAAAARKHYGLSFPQGLLERAVFGLPELHRSQIKSAELISVPGCYPTSAILPIAPLVRAGLLKHGASGLPRVIVDSTSGVSGAGRKAEQRLLLCEVSQQAYGVLTHRHEPEMARYTGADVIFTPHTGPYARGILSTIHVDVVAGVTAASIRSVLEAAYASEPFVRLCPAGVWPGVNDVVQTNFCDIGLAVDESRGHLVLSSAIDNLTKGAAGQAVQCMNIRFGMHETWGLLGSGVVGSRVGGAQ